MKVNLIELYFISQKCLLKWNQHVLKNGLPFFFQKAQNFVYFRPYDFVQISPECDPNTYQNKWRSFRLPMSALVIVTQNGRWENEFLQYKFQTLR